jgi:hypothetical protein
MEFKIFYRLKNLTAIYWFPQKVILVESDSMKQDYFVFSNIIAKHLERLKLPIMLSGNYFLNFLQ